MELCGSAILTQQISTTETTTGSELVLQMLLANQYQLKAQNLFLMYAQNAVTTTISLLKPSLWRRDIAGQRKQSHGEERYEDTYLYTL